MRFLPTMKLGFIVESRLVFLLVLQVVRLNNNQLTYVSPDIALLRQLRTLDLSYNRLNTLPQVRQRQDTTPVS